MPVHTRLDNPHPASGAYTIASIQGRLHLISLGVRLTGPPHLDGDGAPDGRAAANPSFFPPSLSGSLPCYPTNVIASACLLPLKLFFAKKPRTKAGNSKHRECSSECLIGKQSQTWKAVILI